MPNYFKEDPNQKSTRAPHPLLENGGVLLESDDQITDEELMDTYNVDVNGEEA